MDIIDMRKPVGIEPANFVRTLTMLSQEALRHGELAVSFDRKTAFDSNMPDIMMAQSVLTANDSTFTLTREEAKENKDMFTMPIEQRFAKAQAGFKSNKAVVHKTIITKDGKLRGFSTNFDDPKVIKVNFAPNKHNMLKPTG